MGSREIPERHSSSWKKSIVEQTKHQEIEQCCAFPHLNWAVTASNLFLVLIILMSLITPGSCMDFKTVIDNAGHISMLFGAGEDDTSIPSSAFSQLQTDVLMPDRSVKSNGILGSQMIIELESVLVRQTYKITVLMPDRPGYEVYKFVDESCFPGPTLGDSTPLTPNAGVFEVWETARANVTSISPPKPPSKKVKVGYNKNLDNPRPGDLHEYLRVFQVMFIVDDSLSMKGERWNKTRDALATIPDHAFLDTVSLRFLNDKRKASGFQSKEALMSLFDTVTPRGKTPLGKALKTVFNAHLNRIDSAVKKGKNEYSKIPPFNIVVLTDGVPTDKKANEPAKVIARAVKRLNDSHYHPNTMSVQIVQIGNEEKAKKKLADLVSSDNGGIVDVVPLETDLDSEKLQRILLRGVHPNTRQLLRLPTDNEEHDLADSHKSRVIRKA